MLSKFANLRHNSNNSFQIRRPIPSPTFGANDTLVSEVVDAMSPKDFEYLIEQAKKHRLTDAERDAQIRSFTYGNTHLENPSITRSDVDKAVDSLKSTELPWEATRKNDASQN